MFYKKIAGTFHCGGDRMFPYVTIDSEGERVLK